MITEPMDTIDQLDQCRGRVGDLAGEISRLGSGNPVDLRGQNEIALREAVDLVGEDCHFRFAPRQQNIGVVALLLRDGAGAVYKVECLLKIGKAEYSVQMMLPDHFPIGQLRMERIQRIAFERENATTAGNASLVG